MPRKQSVIPESTNFLVAKQVINITTVWCCKNAVNFLPNPHKIHPIARRLGRDMGCDLTFDTLIYALLSQSTQCSIEYRVIFDRVITALDCICGDDCNEKSWKSDVWFSILQVLPFQNMFKKLCKLSMLLMNMKWKSIIFSLVVH